MTLTACGIPVGCERMGLGCASLIWTGVPITGLSDVVPVEVATGFTEGRQIAAAEVSPKVTDGRASVTAVPETTGFSGWSETAATVFCMDVTSGFGVWSRTDPAVIPPGAAAGFTERSVTTPVFGPPGPASWFRVCADTVLGVVAPETLSFSDWIEETVGVTTEEGVTGVAQVAMTISLEVCWTHCWIKLWESGKSCRKALTLF